MDDTLYDLRVDSYYVSGEARDIDGDLVGERCDNCPMDWNQDQANCNYKYEIKLYEISQSTGAPFSGIAGDACDPDPCVALCDEDDRYVREGNCSFSNSPSIVEPEVFTGPGYIFSTGAARLEHFDIGYDQDTGWPRGEAQQSYWCSCWDGEDWLAEMDCKEQCIENGRSNREISIEDDEYNVSGWFETVQTKSYKTWDCSTLEDPSATKYAPPCAPWWIEDQDECTCDFRASLPDWPSHYRPVPRENGNKTHVIQVIDDEYVKYPNETPTNIPFGVEHWLKFWVRPLEGDGFRPLDETTYQPPASAREEVHSGSPLWPDWNNLYLTAQNLQFISFDFGFDDINEVTNPAGRWLVPAASSIWGYPGRKLKVGRDIVWIGERNECPSWPWTWVETNLPEACATCGMPVLEFDAHGRMYKGVYPSRPEEQAIPFETGMAAAVMKDTGAPAPGDSQIIAFGGVDAEGNYSNATWMAGKGEIEEGRTGYLWARLNVGGVQHSPPQIPSPRAYGAMFANPEGDEILLFGGRDELRIFSDMWSLKREDGGAGHPQWMWEKVFSFGDVPPMMSEMSVAQDEGYAVLYGGMTEDGISSDLFMLDIRSRQWTKLGQTTGEPLSRQGASIEYDHAGKVVYLYGGSDDEGVHNDLWKFDMSIGLWTEMIPDCTQGVCPPPDPGSIVLKDRFSDRLTVLPADEGPSGDVYYVPHEHGWVSQAENEGAPDEGDCNGDGYIEAGYGLLCSTGSAWWSVPGKMTCDSMSGNLVCSPSETAGEEIASIRAPGATAFDIEGRYFWLARNRRLECYDASAAAEIVRISFLRLPGRARDVKILDGYAYVASGWRILIIDIRNPADPYVVSEVATCGKAKSIATNGSKLAVASSGGVGLVDVSNPEEPVGLGMLWVFEAGPHLWTNEGSMDECRDLCGLEQFWVDVLGIFGGFGRILEREDHTLYAASRKRLMSFYIMDDSIPALADTIRFRKRIKGLRAHNSFLYMNSGHNETLVIDASSVENLATMGSHEVFWWVKGQEITDDRVYVLDGNRVKVAAVSPATGWIW